MLTDYQILPNFRIRTIPVFGALPAIFGMACAAHVVTHLAGQTFDPEPVLRMQKKQFETQLDRLRDREDARGSQSSSVAVDVEVSFLNRLPTHCPLQDSILPQPSPGILRSSSVQLFRLRRTSYTLSKMFGMPVVRGHKHLCRVKECGGIPLVYA